LLTIPKIIGTVIAIPIKTALEKLVLLRNSNNSFALFDIKFEMRIVV